MINEIPVRGIWLGINTSEPKLEVEPFKFRTLICGRHEPTRSITMSMFASDDRVSTQLGLRLFCLPWLKSKVFDGTIEPGAYLQRGNYDEWFLYLVEIEDIA